MDNYLLIHKFRKICKTFANGSTNKIEFSITRLCKMVKLRGLLGKLLGPMIETGWPLTENVRKPLFKSILVPLRINRRSVSNRQSYSKTSFESRTPALIFSIEK